MARGDERQTSAGQTNTTEAEQGAERFLTLLIDGTALNMPALDVEGYETFRTNIARLSLQVPDRLPQQEKLDVIRQVVREFEVYRGSAEATVRRQQGSWRALASTLLHALLASLGVSTSASNATALLAQLSQLATAPEIDEYRMSLERFVQPGGAGAEEEPASHLRKPDRGTANDNATGLQGGGAAITHLAQVMEAGRRGFVILFRLSCLDVISQRFGMEAVADCLMSVSSYLTQTLRGEDRMFHWSDSALLAILLDRANEQIVSAELDRVASLNRDIIINVNGRMVMLRIPLMFKVVSIQRLKSAEEIASIS